MNLISLKKIYWPRLISAILLFGCSYLQYLQFGFAFGQENSDGNFFFLGGPTLWFATALIPTLSGIYLLFSSLISFRKYSLGINEQTEELTIVESLYKYNQKVVLPFNEINSIEIRNNQLGFEFILVFPLILSSYYLLIDALSLYTYPFITGIGSITAFYYLLQAIINCIVIGLLLFWSISEISIGCINSKDIKSIRFKFYIPIRHRKKNITDILQLIPKDLTNLDSPNSPNNSANNSSIISLVVKLSLIFGLISILIAIFSRVFQFYSNEILRLILLIIGMLIFIQNFKQFNAWKPKSPVYLLFNHLFFHLNVFRNEESGKLFLSKRSQKIFTINFVLCISLICSTLVFSIIVFSFIDGIESPIIIVVTHILLSLVWWTWLTLLITLKKK